MGATTRPGSLLLVLTPVANISLAVLLALLIGLNVGKILAMAGSGAILAIVALTVVATVAGFLLGGPRPETRHVLALGTGQRNMAACFIIGNANFADRPRRDFAAMEVKREQLDQVETELAKAPKPTATPTMCGPCNASLK